MRDIETTFGGVDPAAHRYHYVKINEAGELLEVITVDLDTFTPNNHVSAPTHLAVEKMQYYKGAESSVPEDLLNVNLGAGRVLERFSNLAQSQEGYEYVIPRAWKGQVPKQVMRNRHEIMGYTDHILMEAGAKKKWLGDIHDALGLALYIKKKVTGN